MGCGQTTEGYGVTRRRFFLSHSGPRGTFHYPATRELSTIGDTERLLTL